MRYLYEVTPPTTPKPKRTTMELKLHNPYRDAAARTEHKDLGAIACQPGHRRAPRHQPDEEPPRPLRPHRQDPELLRERRQPRRLLRRDRGRRHRDGLPPPRQRLRDATSSSPTRRSAPSASRSPRARAPVHGEPGVLRRGRGSRTWSTSGTRSPRTSASPGSPTPWGSRSSSAPRTTSRGGSKRR